MELFNVGDKVTVRPDLVHLPCVNPEGMKHWAGATMTIREALSPGEAFSMVEDSEENSGRGWRWGSFMLVPPEGATREQLDRVRAQLEAMRFMDSIFAPEPESALGPKKLEVVISDGGVSIDGGPHGFSLAEMIEVVACIICSMDLEFGSDAYRSFISGVERAVASRDPGNDVSSISLYVSESDVSPRTAGTVMDEERLVRAIAELVEWSGFRPYKDTLSKVQDLLKGEK